MTMYPRCHFLKANVIVCPSSRDLNAGFVKLVEISQSSRMVLCIHCILGGLAFLQGWVRGGLGNPGLPHWVCLPPPPPGKAKCPWCDLILVFSL